MNSTFQTKGAGNDVLVVYGLLVEMADRVSQRRQASNNFYLSVNTALTGASAYLLGLGPSWQGSSVLGLAGLAICRLWIRNIHSYRSLNAAKFAVIADLEKSLEQRPFTEEWVRLSAPDPTRRYTPFYKVETAIPWIFAAVYVAQFLMVVPWRRLVGIG